MLNGSSLVKAGGDGSRLAGKMALGMALTGTVVIGGAPTRVVAGRILIGVRLADW